MEDRNGGAILAIGAVLTVVLLGMWALKFLQKLFMQLGRTFDAFGTMAASGLSMLGNVLLDVLLVAAIIGTVVAAVYFTYRYVMLVRRATDLQEMVDRRLYQSEYNLNQALTEFRRHVGANIDRMNRVLVEALKEPEPVPELQSRENETREVASSPRELSHANNQESQQTDPDSEPPISQPY